MTEKVKSWWSEDGKWFCLLVNDGVNQATVSLTRAEAKALWVDAGSYPPDNSKCDCGAMTTTEDWRGVHSPACEALRL